MTLVLGILSFLTAAIGIVANWNKIKASFGGTPEQAAEDIAQKIQEEEKKSQETGRP